MLVAPYNNAMRLGQGFNSYTHEICVDDAVTIAPNQPENVLTNDGNTMRLTALVLGMPSAWTKQPPVLADDSVYDRAKDEQLRLEPPAAANAGDEEQQKDGAGSTADASATAVGEGGGDSFSQHIAPASTSGNATGAGDPSALAGTTPSGDAAPAGNASSPDDAHAVGGPDSTQKAAPAGESMESIKQPQLTGDAASTGETTGSGGAAGIGAGDSADSTSKVGASDTTDAGDLARSGSTPTPGDAAGSGNQANSSAQDGRSAGQGISALDPIPSMSRDGASAAGQDAAEVAAGSNAGGAVDDAGADSNAAAGASGTSSGAPVPSALSEGSSQQADDASGKEDENGASAADEKKDVQEGAGESTSEKGNKADEGTDAGQADGQSSSNDSFDAKDRTTKSEDADSDNADPSAGAGSAIPREAALDGGESKAVERKPAAAVRSAKAQKMLDDHEAEQAAKKRAAEEAAQAQAAQEAERQRLEKVKRLERSRQLNEREPVMRAAADKFKVNLSLEKMAAMHREFMLPKAGQDDPNAAAPGKSTQVFSIKNSCGISQTVIFHSQFVNALSEITTDMGVSAGLSIKKGAVGGGGRASFIDSDRFSSSDLNYYISVKVINMSIAYKDALEFNNLENVSAADFRKVFGDCFISGFVEGGELNALISMQILNKVKSTDIKAEGQIALGDSIKVEGSGAVQSAKANLELNTETTVQVSWIGGGVVKPPEEAWTIESLSRAASRFPDNVAQSPARTYAILTKYETLRSYQMQQRREVSPIDFKNAALYTNELMDTYMAYKAMYSRITTQISDVQRGTLRFKKLEAKDALELEVPKPTEAMRLMPLEGLSDADKKSIIGRFPDTLDGLDDARREVRMQMNHIINLVDKISVRPEIVLERVPYEKFLPAFAFASLLPELEPTVRTSKRLAGPLTGERMFGEKAEEGDASVTSEVAKLCAFKKQPGESSAAAAAETARSGTSSKKAKAPLKLFADEKRMIETFLAAREDDVVDTLRLTPPLGSEALQHPGELFTALDFVQPSILLREVTVTVAEGVVCGIACRYTNGMSWKRGDPYPDTDDVKQFQLKLNLKAQERITSAIITVGTEEVHTKPEHVISVKLVSNRGRSILAYDDKVKRAGFNKCFIGSGKRAFTSVRTITFESPLERGFLVGFWGRSSQGPSPGVFRLGLVWASSNPVELSRIEAAKMDEKARAARADDAAHEESVSAADRLNRDLTHLESKHAKLQLESEQQQRQIELLQAALASNALAAAEKEKTLREGVARALREAAQTDNLLADRALAEPSEQEIKDAIAVMTQTARLQRERLEGQLTTVRSEKAGTEKLKAELESKLSSAQNEKQAIDGKLSKAVRDLNLLEGVPMKFRQKLSGLVCGVPFNTKQGTLFDNTDQKFYLERVDTGGFKLFLWILGKKLFIRMAEADYCNAGQRSRWVHFTEVDEPTVIFLQPVPNMSNHFFIRAGGDTGWVLCSYLDQPRPGTQLCWYQSTDTETAYWSMG
ncbi:hypothetical protein OC834_005576 [Tilletia horrida]|nr:hypothetical protein OC834_005576 [Tilletia horrida]